MESSTTVEENASSDASPDSRTEDIERCITSLVHACTCQDVDCRFGMCFKMKRVIAHTKACKRRQVVGADCAVCKQLIALCCCHAKHCVQAKCQVPFCQQIRQKMQQSQNRQAEGMVQGMMELQISEGDGIDGSGVGKGSIPSSITSTSQGGEHQLGEGRLGVQTPLQLFLMQGSSQMQQQHMGEGITNQQVVPPCIRQLLALSHRMGNLNF